MIEPIPDDYESVESDCDLDIINKLNEVISEVNNIEAKLQSAPSTNNESFQLLDEMLSFADQLTLDGKIKHRDIACQIYECVAQIKTIS